MPRPEILEGQTTEYTTGCGKLFVTVNGNDHKPYEVMVHGHLPCQSAINMLTRVISLSLRNNLEIDWIDKQLKCVRCFVSTGKRLPTCGAAISKALTEFEDRTIVES